MKNGLDVTSYPLSGKPYGGAGKKIALEIDNETYLVKLPEHIRQKKRDTSYSNSCICEYIGSQIAQSIGLEAQDTYLGVYDERVVVLCKDFVPPNCYLGSFSELQNKIYSYESSIKSTDIEETMKYIDNQDIIEPTKLKEQFFNQFVFDALIGNTDRHNGNWGYLYNQETREYTIAPIYDCGSSLNHLTSLEEKTFFATNTDRLHENIKGSVSSIIKYDNRRMDYYQFITNNRNIEHPYQEELAAAITTIAPRVDMEKIHNIIENTPYISRIEKDFYKSLTSARNELIIQRGLKRELKFQDKLKRSKVGVLEDKPISAEKPKEKRKINFNSGLNYKKDNSQEIS